MKKLFAVIMSLQLILSPLALAEDAPAPDTAPTATGGASGGAGGEDKYLTEGAKSKGGYDFIVNQVLVLATSSIGSSIVTHCPEGLKTISLATFMAGSLVHMASEIAGAKAKNENHQRKLKEYRITEEELKKNGEASQKAALDARLKEEEDTLKFIVDRKKWMTAITAIYLAAAGMAVAEEMYGLGAAISTSTTLCLTEAAACTVGVPACEAACIANHASSQVVLHSNFSHEKAAETARAACLKLPMYVNSCKQGVEAYIKLTYGACTNKPKDGGKLSLSWGTLLKLAYGFGATKIGASGGKISQYGSMLIQLLNMLVPKLSKMVVPAYNMPIPRSITFGASAALAGTVTSGLIVREDKTIQNIVDLKNAIAQFKDDTKGDESGIGLDLPTDGNPGGSAHEPDGTNKTHDLKKLTVNKKKECISNGGGAWEHSEQACTRSFKLTRGKFGQFNIPAINKVGNLAADMAQAIANGDEAGAAGMAGEIGSYAARVKQEVAALQDQYNEYQKKEKQPKTDFDKSIKDQVASLQSSVNDAAASSGVNMASLGTSSPTTVEGVDESKEIVPEVTTASVPAAAAPEADPLAGLSLGSEEAPLEGELPLAEAKPEQSLDEFESTEQDIAKTPEVSIFKQLSNRYILNYNKMFERKKEVEVAGDAPKK